MANREQSEECETTMQTTSPSYNIAILHPDLGVGGAERLIVDVALALKASNHRVTMFTSHHDRRHCFDETVDGQLEVVVAGDWLPRSIFGRLQALFAYLRMIYLTLYVLFFTDAAGFDLFIADLISAGLPLLRARGHKTLFYCHFPDQCLTGRDNLLKRWYRLPLDRFEEWSMGFADLVLVNSNFTRHIFRKTFTRLRHIEPRVLYPTVHFMKSSPSTKSVTFEDEQVNLDDEPGIEHLFLSINRYERKKNHELAILALDQVLCDGSLDTDEHRIRLVIAGGYDLANRENIDYFDELNELVKRLRLVDHVTLLRSISTREKEHLIARSTAVVYTPDNEHFGIVPLEAMYAHRPVIAVNSGGPRETIDDGKTGLLCRNDPVSFATAMLWLINEPECAQAMGDAGHEQVSERFAFGQFQTEIKTVVEELITKHTDSISA